MNIRSACFVPLFCFQVQTGIFEIKFLTCGECHGHQIAADFLLSGRSKYKHDLTFCFVSVDRIVDNRLEITFFQSISCLCLYQMQFVGCVCNP